MRMTSDRHYHNAAITWAVSDFRVISLISVDALEQAYAGEEASYPTVEKLNTATGAMIFRPNMDAVAMASSQSVGHLYRSADGLQIYQARTIGASLASKHADCGTSIETLRDQAK